MMDAARRQHGDLWTLQLPGANFVMVSDPALLEQLFTSDPEVLHTGSSTGKPVMGARSLIILNEGEHEQMRNVLTPFFTPEAVERHHGLAERISEEEVARWPLNEPFPLLPRMENITLTMIMSAIFGVHEADRQQTLRERINTIIAWGSNRVNMARLHASQRKGKPPPRTLPTARDPLDVEVYRVIEEARSDPRLDERHDILAMLLKARYDDGQPMTDQDLRDTLVTLLIQGHASTADALCWAFERMMRTPAAYERLRTELESDGDAYLDAVVKETLRARPPLPIGTRLVNRPYELGGYQLEPGTLLAPCIYLVHHNAEIYPEPESFRPERFLDVKPGKYTWIPFGGGDRSCLGAHFAMREIKAVLRTLVPRTRLQPDVERDEEIKLRRVGLSPSRQARAVLVERVPASRPAAAASAT